MSSDKESTNPKRSYEANTGIVNAPIILGAGAAGVGKSFRLKHAMREMKDTYWLDKDVLQEQFLHANPFDLASPDGTKNEDSRLSFQSEHYKQHLRDQVYAAMFYTGFKNSELGKSTVLDANYVGWIKEPYGRISLARRLVNLGEKTGIDIGNFRVPIIYFHVTEPDVVLHRIKKRAENDPAAYDRDKNKIENPKLWLEQIRKEPVTLIDDAKKYSDICFVDATKEGEPKELGRITEQIIEFLRRDFTIADVGIFKSETLEETIEKLKK